MKVDKKLCFRSKQLKNLYLGQQHYLIVLDKFQAKISQKRTWSIFTKISDPGYAKKFKKS